MVPVLVEFRKTIFNFMGLFFTPCTEYPVPECKHASVMRICLLLF